MKKIKILIFLTLIFILILSNFNISNAGLLSNLLNNKKVGKIIKYNFATGENAVQGSCSDGKYIYLAVVSKEGKQSPYLDQKTNIVVINAQTKELIKRVYLGKVGHCNSIAYNSKNKTITLAPCSSQIKWVYQVSTDDIINSEETPTVTKVYFKNKKNEKIETTISAMSYNSKTNEYFIRWGNKKIKVFDSNLKEVRDIELSSKLKPFGNYVGQAIFVNSKYIYYIYNYLGFGLDDSINYIKVFNHKGNLVDYNIISDTGSEFESMFMLNNKLYAIGNSIDKVKNKKHYSIKLFELNL